MAVAQRVRPLLGTLVSVRCRADDVQVASNGLEAAFAAVGRVDRLMHPSRAGSELSALRRLVAGSFYVDPWTWAVLRAAAELHVESNRLFDPCLAVCPGSLADLRFIEPNRIETARPVAVDLGGIAKGFAVDRAVDALRHNGCSAGEVNAGGDLRVFGTESSDLWIRVNGRYRSLRLRDAACAVSDVAAIERPPEHLGYRRHDRSVTVLDVASSAVIVASTAMWADGLATYAVVCQSPAEHARLRAVLALHDARRIDVG